MIDLADTFMDHNIQADTNYFPDRQVSPITIRNAFESPLLTLRGELRNAIYAYVFDDDGK
jgi:hypothetical protein